MGSISYVYDGDGNRVKKIENGQTTVYVNKYYEKNITSGEDISSYYLGNKLIAQLKGISPTYNLSYIYQDSLGSTSATADASGSLTSTIKQMPYGATRLTSGTAPTDKLFTGQRRDISTSGSELYYYRARYYDPNIGRFISADSLVPDINNPQALNRYSYCLNNPLKYTDPTGHFWEIFSVLLRVFDIVSTGYDAGSCATDPTNQEYWQNLTLDIATFGFGSIMTRTTSNLPRLTKATESEMMRNVSCATENTTHQLQNLAKDVNETIAGNGPVNGTLKYTLFKQKVEALKIPGMETEKSLLGGNRVDYGTEGSVRVDAILDHGDNTYTVWDLKTGDARLTQKRIDEIKQAVGGKHPENITVIEVK